MSGILVYWTKYNINVKTLNIVEYDIPSLYEFWILKIDCKRFKYKIGICTWSMLKFYSLYNKIATFILQEMVISVIKYDFIL